jgi:hypothetical protein
MDLKDTIKYVFKLCDVKIIYADKTPIGNPFRASSFEEFTIQHKSITIRSRKKTY